MRVGWIVDIGFWNRTVQTQLFSTDLLIVDCSALLDGVDFSPRLCWNEFVGLAEEAETHHFPDPDSGEITQKVALRYPYNSFSIRALFNVHHDNAT